MVAPSSEHVHTILITDPGAQALYSQSGGVAGNRRYIQECPMPDVVLSRGDELVDGVEAIEGDGEPVPTRLEVGLFSRPAAVERGDTLRWWHACERPYFGRGEDTVRDSRRAADGSAAAA